MHPKVRVASWAEGAAWEGFVDGAGALVNLAGETIAQRWTAAAKARIGPEPPERGGAIEGRRGKERPGPASS